MYSPSVPRYHRSIIINVFSSLFFVFGVSQAQRLIWTGVIEFVCVADIIPRRVNKGYAPSTRRPRHNKGLVALLSFSLCVCVRLSLNESSCYQIRMNNKRQTPWSSVCPQMKVCDIKEDYVKSCKHCVCVCKLNFEQSNNARPNIKCVYIFVYIHYICAYYYIFVLQGHLFSRTTHIPRQISLMWFLTQLRTSRLV